MAFWKTISFLLRRREKIMAFAALPWAGLILLLGLGGGTGLPLGVPPAEEDPVMANVAPEECLFYTTWSGMAEPDPESTNETEKLLAEPEVQHLIGQLEKRIVAALREEAADEGPEAEALLDDAVDWAKLALTGSGALFVSKVAILPGKPDVRGGLLVKVGDAADRVKASIEKYQRMAPQNAVQPVQIEGNTWYQITLDEDAPKLTWGTSGEYLVAGLGEGSAEGILERMKSEPPNWLAELRGQLAVGRRSTFTYVNLGTILDMVGPMMGGPQAVAVINAIGLGNVTALASATGLDEQGFVSKTLVAIDGEPTGILGLVGEPLTADDIASIPADATIAGAVSHAGANEVFEVLASIVSTIEPRARGEMEQGLAEITQQTGIDIRNDVLKPLGDVWCFYNSPGEGGLVLTGLTAVVKIADPERMAQTHRKIQSILQAMMLNQGDRRRGPSIDKFDFAGHEVYVFNAREEEFPLAPSWCLTDSHLVLSLFPQNVKAYLSRGDDFQSINQVPEVAKLVSGDTGTVKFLYVDARKVFELAYPILQMVAQAGMSELRREGIDLDVSLLPSVASVSKHLRPAVVAVRRTSAGLEVVSRQTLPGGNATAVTPLVLFVGFDRVAPPRAIGPFGRRTESANNMKQIALALHNYHDTYRTLPPAYTTDDAGNPLLSWRVLILPFVEQQGLYEQFRLDEPWDSEHNKRLIAMMPEVYRSPAGSNEPGKTNYLGVGGENGIFPGQEGVRFAQITDGTSNTVMTVEVNNESAVIWTRPQDYQPDPDNPARGLVGVWPSGCHVGFTDGSVRFVEKPIPNDVWMLLFNRQDGKPIPSF
jgi:hypothetical protein